MHLPGTSKAITDRQGRLSWRERADLSNPVPLLEDLEAAPCQQASDDQKSVSIGLQTSIQSSDMSTQTDRSLTALYTYSKLNEKQLVYISGFNHKQFHALMQFLTEDISNLPVPVSMPIEDQLLLVLYTYRHACEMTRLAIDFDRNRIFCKKVLTFWTNHMYRKLKSVKVWDCVKIKPGEYTTVIDCTEFFLQSSSDPENKQVCYSEYKGHQTLKALTGVSEGGVVMFCSDLYGGSVSDREIFTVCGIRELLKRGDTILVDKGFTV